MDNNNLVNQILTGNARELSKEIEDNSIDLIFCDPIYSRIDDYRWLGQLAMRVLKQNSACLVWTGIKQLARAQQALEQSGLGYQWTLHYAEFGRNSMFHLYGVTTKITPLLYFAKGRRKASPYIPDLIISSALADFKKGHEFYFEWQKNEAMMMRYLKSFSKPGDLVLDPFTGSGTVPAVCKQNYRNYVAFEIDPDRAELARRRVLTTQMPMLLLDNDETENVKQLDMAI